MHAKNEKQKKPKKHKKKHKTNKEKNKRTNYKTYTVRRYYRNFISFGKPMQKGSQRTARRCTSGNSKAYHTNVSKPMSRYVMSHKNKPPTCLHPLTLCKKYIASSTHMQTGDKAYR